MAVFADPQQIAFLAGLVALSALIAWAMTRVRILDMPNRRSSHHRPVPRLGGVAIVVTVMVGLFVLRGAAAPGGLAGTVVAGFALATLAVALVGLMDDLGRIGLAGKLAGQLAAAAVLLGFGVVLRRVSLPGIGPVELGWWGYALTAFWVVAVTNMVNFMDGLDGLAGGTGAIAAAGLAVVAQLSGAPESAQLAAAIAAACVGFTLFNLPPARIFMGDVGSQFLGFALAALAVIAADYDRGHTSVFVMPLLLFHFIFDTVFTFFRRLTFGEAVTQAHRGHLYQLMNRLGASHLRVSLFHWAVNLAQLLGAVWMVTTPGDRRVLVFLPFLAFETIYAVAVMRAARRRGLFAG